jgi:hypothetical protein
VGHDFTAAETVGPKGRAEVAGRRVSRVRNAGSRWKPPGSSRPARDSDPRCTVRSTRSAKVRGRAPACPYRKLRTICNHGGCPFPGNLQLRCSPPGLRSSPQTLKGHVLGSAFRKFRLVERSSAKATVSKVCQNHEVLEQRSCGQAGRRYGKRRRRWPASIPG